MGSPSPGAPGASLGADMSATVGMAQRLEVPLLAPGFGAEIIGVDLAAGVDEARFRVIYDAFLRYQVLLFGAQDLPPGRQVEFARHFGEVQVHVMNQYHADGFPELYRLSNLDAQGKPSGHHPDRGTLAWHTDGSWQPR